MGIAGNVLAICELSTPFLELSSFMVLVSPSDLCRGTMDLYLNCQLVHITFRRVNT